MSLDKATVRSIAALARVHVPEEELEHLAGELSRILGWIEQLNEVATAGVEPMTSVVEMRLRMRADEVTDGGLQEEVLADAPERAGPFFAVPKVVE
ncbi:MAG: Asp-tRNA(Asn)/Glu-tRNA(Gln) amidotransferase subunit GatC [Proteobacteria bacterium]|nr:Asp-tRNA(Asn)/Glu-tRNA(Gln) amidotransferase subunit GatC [Pseudomonadota bacterium]